jgi:WD40 repeat protein
MVRNKVLLKSSIILSVQAILRLWKFETRRCLCATRVLNTHDLYVLDFGIENSSSSLVTVGHDEQSRIVVCVYNASNALKGSIELISRATTNISITHLRFVPYDITKFLSIGTDNIHFWRIKNENDLQSISLSENPNDLFEYTDLQFDYLSKNKSNELIVYISTKTGQILEILYDERRVIQIHYLSEKMTKNFTLSTFAFTNHFAITGSHDGYVRVWSIDFSQVYIEAKYDQSILNLIASYDQTRILIRTESGSLSILNLVTKVHLNLMRTHTKSITDIDYDDNRKQMISVGQDGTIRIWCFRTNKQLSEFISEKEIPLIVTYSPNRHIFACGFNNGTIKIFDLNTSMILNELK